MKNSLVLAIILCLIFSTITVSCRKEIDSSLEPKKSTDSIEKNETSIQTDNAEFDFLPSSTTNQVVEHKYYTLSYNETYEQAEWVAYELKGVKSYHDYERALKKSFK
ncbi:hypothetical protein [Flavobacterium sp.]|jgi:endonuclease G|uniref:hypothetical protein n=1 Tax=Flavobacterium sp. TaxID=239 RepID=UPI0037BF5B64